MAEASSALVKLHKVHLSYQDRCILDDLCLEIRSGEIIGLLGRIGAGKTRVLRLIAGLESPDRGQVLYSPPAHRYAMGFAFQHDTLIPWLTVEENLRLAVRDGSKLHSLPASDWPLVTQTGLGRLLALKPFQLSGGMRKKVNFARAFLNHDPLVLLDEPFTALDPSQKKEIQRLFFSLMSRRPSAAVVVTHDIREALLICDRICFLSVRDKRITLELCNSLPRHRDIRESELLTSASYREMYALAEDFYRREAEELGA
ncbi:MAG: ABC transporter ATP-binding protein [Bdellovibrionales bacterium]